MNIDQVMEGADQRTTHFFRLLLINMLVFIACLLAIAFGNTERLVILISVLAISSAILQIAAGDGAIKDISAIRADMPEEMKNSSFGQSFDSAPFGMFRGLNFIIPTAIAASIVYTVI